MGFPPFMMVYHKQLKSPIPVEPRHNRFRPHSTLKKKTPDEAYAVMLPPVELAA